MKSMKDLEADRRSADRQTAEESIHALRWNQDG